MNKTEIRQEELMEKMIEIIKDASFFSLKLNKNEINGKTSLISDLTLDSIQLLEYLVKIEEELELNLDYDDINIEIFDSFENLANYFYEKI